MLPPADLQPLCSFCLALAVFTSNIRGASLTSGDNADKRRQRIIFKMLSTSSSEEAIVSAPDESDKPIASTNKRQFDGSLSNVANLALDVDIEDLNKRRDSGLTIKGDSNGPPILGKDKASLTYAMMERFKTTWCKTEPFYQLIKEPGCISRQVQNRFCYGQCNSFYIPKTIRRRTKRKVFKSCGFCRPKRTNTIIVTLKCPGRKKGYKQKKVRQVKECACRER